MLSFTAMVVERGSRLLVIRLSSLGDVARLLPCLHSLRVSGHLARLDLAVEDRFAPLLELFPVVDRVAAYPRRNGGLGYGPLAWARAMGSYLTDLRAAGYDWSVDLHGILRSALLGQVSGAARTAGYARGFGKEGSHLLYDVPLTCGATPRISRYARYAGAMAALGLPGPAGGYLSPLVREGDRAEVGRFLEGRGLAPRSFLFAFIGTSRAQAYKRWPLERFLELASLVWEGMHLPTVVGWGPDEAQQVAALPSREYLHVVPTWSLPQLLECIRSSAAFVGADTGAMHLAALMGVPTVALLGPTDPVLNEPWGRRAKVVYRPGIHTPCSGPGCDHRSCMGAIGAQEVFDSLKEVLAPEGQSVVDSGR
ncbi:MAG: glycosyltransferase family 9 protein [Acidobacteriota bacterium]